jgi:hypothetical protein
VRRPPKKRASRSVAISSGSAKPAHCSCTTRSRAICRLCSPWLKPGPNRYANTVAFVSGAGRRVVEPRVAAYDKGLSCSNARNELVQERKNAAFPNLQRNSVMQPVSPTTFSKFLFVDKLLSRLDVMPYLVGKPWRGDLASVVHTTCNHSNGEFHVRSTNTIGLRTECRR